MWRLTIIREYKNIWYEILMFCFTLIRVPLFNKIEIFLKSPRGPNPFIYLIYFRNGDRSVAALAEKKDGKYSPFYK